MSVWSYPARMRRSLQWCQRGSFPSCFLSFLGVAFKESFSGDAVCSVNWWACSLSPEIYSGATDGRGQKGLPCFFFRHGYCHRTGSEGEGMRRMSTPWRNPYISTRRTKPPGPVFTDGRPLLAHGIVSKPSIVTFIFSIIAHSFKKILLRHPKTGVDYSNRV